MSSRRYFRYIEGHPARMVLIGQAPGPKTDPSLPLYPLPSTSAGGRLQTLCGIGRSEYLRVFIRHNLLREFPGKNVHGDDRFPMPRARAAAKTLGNSLLGRRVILVGRKVAEAFDMDVDFFEWTPSLSHCFELAVIPHPSGRNHFYNDPDNRTRAFQFLSSAVKPALEVIPGWNAYLDTVRANPVEEARTS